MAYFLEPWRSEGVTEENEPKHLNLSAVLKGKAVFGYSNGVVNSPGCSSTKVRASIPCLGVGAMKNNVFLETSYFSHCWKYNCSS